ncbi:MAG: flippase-like domain-containing protein [Nitrospirae bacterium]|nr:flippase-like domain-containing protein [Nitrospirota bacterium]
MRVTAGTVLSLGLLLYIGHGLWIHWEQIRDYPYEVRPFLLIFSGMLLLGAYGIFFLFWKLLLSALGERISYPLGYRIWFLSQLGKYVPGKVWGAVGRVFLLRQAGIGTLGAFMSVVYELILMILSGLIFSGLTLPFWGGEIPIASLKGLSPGLLILLLILSLLILLHPRVWSRMAGLMRRFSGGVPPAEDRTPGYRVLLGLSVSYVLLWGGIGVSFYLFVISLVPLSLSMLPAVAGIFVFAWVGGSLVFLAPGGLGVREGLLVLSLGSLISPEIALVAAVGSRIWATVVEFIGISLGFVFRANTNRMLNNS